MLKNLTQIIINNINNINNKNNTHTEKGRKVAIYIKIMYNINVNFLISCFTGWHEAFIIKNYFKEE